MTDPIDVSKLYGGMPGAAGPGAVSGSGAAGKAKEAPSGDFKSILIGSLEEVDRLQDEADAGVQKLLTGETDNVAEVFAAANKAGVAFDLLMEVRNKLTDAYREIQQMRV